LALAFKDIKLIDAFLRRHRFHHTTYKHKYEFFCHLEKTLGKQLKEQFNVEFFKIVPTKEPIPKKMTKPSYKGPPSVFEIKRSFITNGEEPSQDIIKFIWNYTQQHREKIIGKVQGYIKSIDKLAIGPLDDLEMIQSVITQKSFIKDNNKYFGLGKYIASDPWYFCTRATYQGKVINDVNGLHYYLNEDQTDYAFGQGIYNIPRMNEKSKPIFRPILVSRAIYVSLCAFETAINFQFPDINFKWTQEHINQLLDITSRKTSPSKRIMIKKKIEEIVGKGDLGSEQWWKIKSINTRQCSINERPQKKITPKKQKKRKNDESDSTPKKKNKISNEPPSTVIKTLQIPTNITNTIDFYQIGSILADFENKWYSKINFQGLNTGEEFINILWSYSHRSNCKPSFKAKPFDVPCQSNKKNMLFFYSLTQLYQPAPVALLFYSYEKVRRDYREKLLEFNKWKIQKAQGNNIKFKFNEFKTVRIQKRLWDGEAKKNWITTYLELTLFEPNALRRGTKTTVKDQLIKVENNEISKKLSLYKCISFLKNNRTPGSELDEQTVRQELLAVKDKIRVMKWRTKTTLTKNQEIR